MVKDPPRTYPTGRGEPIRIADCGTIELAANEQVTFVTAAKAEWDVTRKAWGFYATPSLNGRLLTYGLRGVLAKSHVGKYYVFLVERGQEEAFRGYLESEQNSVVRWLDNDEDLAAASASTPGEKRASVPLHCMCGADRFVTAHTYFAPPEGEVRFASTSGREYRREIFRCSVCGHYVSVHAMAADGFYDGAYVDGTYGDEAGMRKAYERIVGLPPERSDNAGRVRRIREFAARHFGSDAPRSVLDVGSGLCVFLHGMKREGWRCTALDPDARAARHAREVVGVEALCADFFQAPDLGKHDVVTLNRVLEHVVDPIAMLARAKDALADGGLVYVELPDGDGAAQDPAAFGREEFFVEHHHVFGAASTALLAERGGFEVLAIERLREPSTKYTLRGFLRPRRLIHPR